MYTTSPSEAYDNLRCNDNCIYPIEHLYKSIFIMQNISELDKETERLKKQLHKYLVKDTKEKDGIRIWNGRVKYYPTGECSWDRTTIVLQGYQTNYIPPEPEITEIVTEVDEVKKKRRQPVKRKFPVESGLRDSYILWYAQLREYQKKKYTISDNDKYKLKETLKKREIYNALSEGEQKLLDKTHDFHSEFNRLGNNIFRKLANSHVNEYMGKEFIKQKRPLLIPFLTEDELDDLLAVCNLAYSKYTEKGYGYLSRCVNEEMRKFTEQLDMQKEGRVIIDLTETINIKIETHTSKGKTWNNENGQYEDYTHSYETERWDYTGIIDRMKEEIEAIEDETILKILSNFGLSVK